MSLQTRKTFIHLWNKNEALFFPSIGSYATDTLTLQKVHKEIVKLIYMN